MIDTSALSYQDEEIVVRGRAGELPHATARALRCDLLVVMRALNRALVLGIPARPASDAAATPGVGKAADPAGPCRDRRDRRAAMFLRRTA